MGENISMCNNICTLILKNINFQMLTSEMITVSILSLKNPRQIDNLKFVLNWCFYVRFTEIMQNPLNNLSQSPWLNENVKTTVISSYNCISDVIKKTCRKIGMVREGISKIKNLQFFFFNFFLQFFISCKW